mgnify:CR=1 FL=1|tara:strand:+ start:441 stop:824 length:384 start_codon:yes stop_codon:yes gene_type:complete
MDQKMKAFKILTGTLLLFLATLAQAQTGSVIRISYSQAMTCTATFYMASEIFEEGSQEEQLVSMLSDTLREYIEKYYPETTFQQNASAAQAERKRIIAEIDAARDEEAGFEVFSGYLHSCDAMIPPE